MNFKVALSKSIFRLAAGLLNRSRRLRLQDELSADLLTCSPNSSVEAHYLTYAGRAVGDLSRLQNLNVLIYTSILVTFCIISWITKEVSLLGLFIVQALFSRVRASHTVKAFLTEGFYAMVNFIALANLVLGLLYGIGTFDTALGSTGIVLFASSTAIYIAMAVASNLDKDRISLRSHLFAKWLHSSLSLYFVAKLTILPNPHGYWTTIGVGTMGWITIMVLNSQRPKEPVRRRASIRSQSASWD